MHKFQISAESPLILASQSPRRKQLLELAELPFRIQVQPTEENYPAELATEDVPVFIAREKAKAVQASLNNEVVVLAADTIVVLDHQIIGKPIDRAAAIQTLTALSGKSHQVITGVVLLQGASEISFSDITTVEFHPLTEAQICFYVDKYQPYDKAGAYAIQEWIGAIGIAGIFGDFYNVMGLPVSRLMQHLRLTQ